MDEDRVSMRGGGRDDGSGGRLNDIVEFWLISAPGESTCQQTWDSLQRITGKYSGLTTNFKLHIPDLKVGTLDQLVSLSEELTKLDIYVESVVRKVAQYFADVLEDERDKVKENLLANGLSLANYVTHFQWDMAKYPAKHALHYVCDIVSKQVTQIDADLKTKSLQYNNVRGSLQNIERKATGSLLTRALHDVIKEDDVVSDSDYLITLIVAVPTMAQKEWWAKYEQLSDMVVPRSSKVVTQDSENILVTVTVFRKVVDEYKLHCRENKFIVRDYHYSKADNEANQQELTRLTAEKKTLFGQLVRWLKVNFGEAFVAWMHIKVLRVFVESVLRYGLPVNFQAMVLAPPRKNQRKLRDILNQHYAKLDNTPKGSKSDIVDLPGLNMSSSDYFPYVFFKISIDMVE
jgi:V-type H+-transporting ATPase subunit C